MKLIILIFVTCLLSSCTGKSQTTSADSSHEFLDFGNFPTTSKPTFNDASDKDFAQLRHLLDSAATALNGKDTLKAIRILQIFEVKYPKDSNLKGVKYNIGILYFEMGQLQRAKQQWNQMVSEPIFYEGYGLLPFRFTKDFPNYNFRATLQLAEIAIMEKNFESAKKWLSKAETNYFPKTECANAANLLLNESAWVYAKYYCAIGDTTFAIERLLYDYFHREGCFSIVFTNHVKSLLQSKYTQKEIQQGVQKSISSIKHTQSIKNKLVKNNYFFILLGSTISIKEDSFSEEDYSPKIITHLEEKINVLAD